MRPLAGGGVEERRRERQVGRAEAAEGGGAEGEGARGGVVPAEPVAEAVGGGHFERVDVDDQAADEGADRAVLAHHAVGGADPVVDQCRRRCRRRRCRP
ncbi:hypothetical protein [Craurococcus roseus]|uniref:hypothetical protein n=1 Tax=Craurococcus roseus TaxID=77585 RepID=UPI0031DAD71F